MIGSASALIHVAMDIKRAPDPKKKQKRIIFTAAGVLVVLAVTLGLSRLKPAAPGVSRSTVWIDEVKRGSMLRQVRGTGTLVPEEIRWIPAETPGFVQKIVLKAGSKVSPDTVIIQLYNTELMQQSLDASLQLRAAEADLIRLKAQLENDSLNQKSNAASIEADYKQALAQAEADEAMAKDGVIPALNAKLSKSRAEGLKARHRVELDRIAVNDRSIQAQVAAQQARVDQLRALANLRQEQVNNLTVRAGIEGILQVVPVDVGQQVLTGTNLARVAQPERLKAQLRVPETQAKDILIGQPAEVDTHNGVVKGEVARIDPASQNGTVTVDIAITDALPKGARPDLSVDGTINLEKLDNVIYVGRPAFGKEDGTIGMFKLEPDGTTAALIQVKLGRSSVKYVEILGGLNPGDKVILSDTSAYDNVERIRLE
jgi:HlyD family secretion protein